MKGNFNVNNKEHHLYFSTKSLKKSPKILLSKILLNTKQYLSNNNYFIKNHSSESDDKLGNKRSLMNTNSNTNNTNKNDSDYCPLVKSIQFFSSTKNAYYNMNIKFL